MCCAMALYRQTPSRLLIAPAGKRQNTERGIPWNMHAVPRNGEAMT